MNDLDEYVLHDIARNGPVYKDDNGVEHSCVPRDILLRVTEQFDVAGVREAMFGKYRQ